MLFKVNEFKISLLAIFYFCLSCEVAFLVLDLCVNWLQWSSAKPIRRLFNIAREDSLPSLFAVLQSAMIALLCWIIYIIHSRCLIPCMGNSFGWLLVALLFTYLTIDDGALVHERIGTVFKYANSEITLPSYGWQIILAPVFALMGLLLFCFLWFKGGKYIHKGLLIAALTCLGSAVVIDYFEGTTWAYKSLSGQIGYSKFLISHFSKATEEFLEMLGMTFFLILFLRYFIMLTEQIEMRIRNGVVEFLDSK